MNRFKKKRMACLLLSTMFCLSLVGCGKQLTEVTDYGSDHGAASDVENAGEGDGKPAGEDLSAMLGGTQLEYNNAFSVGSKNVTLNLNYNVNETESLSEYLVEAFQDEAIDEQKIVDSFFGDSAIPLNSKDDKISEENEDSLYTISAAQLITYNNTKAYPDSYEAAAWVDEATYFIHTYNGMYRGCDYQLLISYSKSTHDFIVTLFPIKYGDLVDDPTCEYMDFSTPDGNYYGYFQNNIKVIALDEVMADRPNVCDMPDDQIIDITHDSLKDMMGLEIPKNAFSLYDNIYNLVTSYTGEPKRCEILFYPESALSTENFDGAIRKGYALTMLGTLDNQKVMTNMYSIEEPISLLDSCCIGVDNEGILGMYLSTRFNFKEKLTDGVEVLSFKEAMDKFVENAPTSLNLDDSRLNNKVTFDVVEFVYFPVPVEGSTSEYKLIPAWALDTLNSSGEPIARVFVNAEDGSYITTLFKPTDE